MLCGFRTYSLNCKYKSSSWPMGIYRRWNKNSILFLIIQENLMGTFEFETLYILVWTRKENTSDVTLSAKPCSSWRRPKPSLLCSLWRQMLPLTDPWTMTPLCTDPPWASASATTSTWWRGMTPTGGSGGRCSKTVSSASFHPQLNWRIFGYRWVKSAKLSGGHFFKNCESGGV